MINILQAVGSIGIFIMAILYLISVMVQIKQTKMSFIPFLAFDQMTMEQEGKNLKLRNLTETDSDYVNTAFKLQNLGGGIAKNIDIKVHLKENEIEEFKKLILSLGKSEVESQERLIDLTVENLKKLTIESKEDIKNKGNLYKKLITFSGICIGIILI